MDDIIKSMSDTKYSAELYYFQDQKDFPFSKGVLVTAETVGSWCSFYQARLLSPKKGVQERLREGQLPADKLEKQKFIAGLFEWIQNNSLVPDLFALFLDSEPIKDPTGFKNPYCPKFCHHDDTCCWDISLTEQEFSQLKLAWKTNNLPEDLFYPAGLGICVPYKAKSFLGKMFIGIFGGQRCYTPKQWEMEKTNRKNS